MKTMIISIWGLFFPYRRNGKWATTLSIGHVPVGWIWFAQILVVELILRVTLGV